MFLNDNDTKIGVVLIVISIACFTISVMLFLNRSFLIIANISFLMGIVSLIGQKNTFGFFSKKGKITGSIVYFLGFIIMIIGYTFFTTIGFCLQIYGIFLLFR